jgi:hypothetical protein
MKKFLILLLLFSSAANASWVRRFGISDQQYRVSITTTSITHTTAGFFLTSFPCYSQNSSEYFRTVLGRNIITLFCLEPPKEIFLAYVTKQNGALFTRNDRMDGYMRCPVRIAGLGVNSVIPRLNVVLEECDRRELNREGNRQILGMGATEAGEKVRTAMTPEDARRETSGSGPLSGEYETQLDAEEAGQTLPPANPQQIRQPAVRPHINIESMNNW